MEPQQSQCFWLRQSIVQYMMLLPVCALCISAGTAAIFPYKSYMSDGGISIYPQTSYTYTVSAAACWDAARLP
jgi:hypothetical protein